jgi:hypothetical protein
MMPADHRSAGRSDGAALERSAPASRRYIQEVVIQTNRKTTLTS